MFSKVLVGIKQAISQF